MNVLQRVDEMTLFGDTRGVIARFVLEKRSSISRYTLQEIAEQTFTSKTTLVRFAQALGYKGWREFLQAFLEKAYHQDSYFSDIDPNIPFSETDPAEDIINKISSLQVESILDTADMIQIPVLKKAVEILMRSDRIAVLGLSPNSLCGELFRRKMLAIGITVTVPRVDEGGAYACALTERDCAIVISYAGNQEVRSPMKFVPIMEKHKVPLIGITGEGENYIRRHMDCVFTMSSRERLYSKIAGFSTEMSVITILNILFSCCFQRNYKANWDYKLSNASVLESERNATVRQMREAESCSADRLEMEFSAE